MKISMKDYLSTLPSIKIANGVRRVHSISGGNQEKWILPEQRLHLKAAYTKSETTYKDYVCEELAYLIGKQFGFDMLLNKACIINTENNEQLLGSYSEIFTTNTEEFIPTSKLCDKHFTDTFCTSWDRLTTKARLERIVALYSEACNLDATKYIVDMITLDYLIGNVDRHMSNFGVIYDVQTNNYKLPPHFDNGLSFFEFDSMFDKLTLEESMNRLYAQPFGDYFQEVYRTAVTMFGSGEVKLCRLDGLTFPSIKALNYFEYVAEKLNIPLIGEALWIGE